jgi:hypothetical protein
MREQDERGEIELAEERAVENKTIEIAKEMIKENFTKQQILKITKLPIETIEKLIEQMKK